jgi:dephospho-CoA kinase
MLTVGLTGGIGSGKSTFAGLLARRGAQVVDADAIGRTALEPGQQAWHSVVDTFGDEARLADIVFANPKALAALNAIVHPIIVSRIAETLEMLRGTDEIVVIDAALIVEIGLTDALDVLVVVDAPEDVRRTRLVDERQMSIEDINARMRVQADPTELADRADIVVKNNGSLDDLDREAQRVWEELSRLSQSSE